MRIRRGTSYAHGPSLLKDEGEDNYREVAKWPVCKEILQTKGKIREYNMLG